MAGSQTLGYSANFAKEISWMQHKFCQGDFSLTFSFLWHIAWVMYADGKPMNIFESGAILQYLAEKTGKFLSQHPHVKLETFSGFSSKWLMLHLCWVRYICSSTPFGTCMVLQHSTSSH
jgi:hypothetical protein